MTVCPAGSPGTAIGSHMVVPDESVLVTAWRKWVETRFIRPGEKTLWDGFFYAIQDQGISKKILFPADIGRLILDFYDCCMPKCGV